MLGVSRSPRPIMVTDEGRYGLVKRQELANVS